MADDYYSELGVGKDATPEEIEKAYRRKAQKIAPRTDAECNDKERSNALMRLNEAYDALGNARKRAHYDETGKKENLNPIEHQALQVIFGVLSGLLEQAEEANFVECVVLNLRNNLDTIGRKKPELEKLIKRAEKQRKCIRHKLGKENLLDRVFSQRIAALQEKIDEIPEAIEIGKKALEIMKDYENAYTAPVGGTYRPQVVGLDQIMQDFFGAAKGRRF